MSAFRRRHAARLARKRRSCVIVRSVVLSLRIIACSEKGGVKAERVKTGPVCSQRRPAGESKACFAEPPQSKRRIPLRRKPAKAPVLASPNSDPAKATCGWFWVPFATKRYKTPCGDSRETFAL